MNKKKSFFIKLAIVLTGIFVADKGIGTLLQRSYHSIQHGEPGRMNYTVDSVKTSLLILGSSRASHHYVPSVFSGAAGISCYNAGKDKQGLFYQLAMLKIIMVRQRPQHIILDLTPFAFEPAERSLDELAVLLPYYNQHPEIRDILNMRSKWEPVKTKSSLYCYNSLLLQIVFNNLSKSKDATAENGYVPLYKNIQAVPVAHIPAQRNATTDSSLLNAFKGIISMAKQNDCKLTVVVSPMYEAIVNGTPTLQLARKLCEQESVPFYDYSLSATFTGKQALFADVYHLNDTGARLFSHVVYNELSKDSLNKIPSNVPAD